MDWLIVITVIASAAAIAAIIRAYRIKREVYIFAERMEEVLDQMAQGQGLGREQTESREEIESREQIEDREDAEELTDTIWGKCVEKLNRVSRVWQKKEEESLREKEELKSLISDISHQTKTPIANLKLCLELWREESLGEKEKEYLDSMERQTEKLDFLLQNMVKMSRLETGIIQIHRQRGNLYGTLAAAVAQIVPKAAKKNIGLSVECPEKLNVCHDKKWTEEAIFNVLDNGVKYTEPGGSIKVKAVCQEMFVKLVISDTGKGISPSQQAQIFTRFYREPEVHQKPGIGIGLYLTRKILELEGGYIEVSSGEGKGASFYLYLPL